MFDKIKEFHDKFGPEPLRKPGFPPDEEMEGRLNFQLEELLETSDASGFELLFLRGWPKFSRRFVFVGGVGVGVPQNLPETLDGIVDQLYVLLGTAHVMGFLGPDNVLLKAFDRVHEANMKKVRIPGAWKVQKPEGWERPNLEDLV